MNSLRRRVMADTFIVPDGAVDLGLPSRTLWATCNLGAATPKEAGLYFSWGNIEGHVGGTYNFSSSNYNSSPGYNVDTDIPTYDAQHGTNHDAARNMLGGGWRMPTKEEYQELYDNTDFEITTINGVYGAKFMKKTNHSVYVFFPFVGGYYVDDNVIDHKGTAVFSLSSSYKDSTHAHYLAATETVVVPKSTSRPRGCGYSIRPVYDPNL